MPTDDERREVEKRLRDSAFIVGEKFRVGDSSWSKLYRTVFEAGMMPNPASATYNILSGRLADLIDPESVDESDETGRLSETSLVGTDPRQGIELGLPMTVLGRVDPSVIEAIRESISCDNGQTLRSSLLMECPFCGCKGPSVQISSLFEDMIESRVVCGCCHVSTSRECQSWRVVSDDGEDVTRLVVIGRSIAKWNCRARGSRDGSRRDASVIGGRDVL